MVSEGEEEGGGVGDAGYEGFVAVLVEPWVVGAGAVGLDVVEAGDGGEGDAGVEEGPWGYVRMAVL